MRQNSRPCRAIGWRLGGFGGRTFAGSLLFDALHMSFPDTTESPLVAAHPEAYTSSAATKPKTRPPFRPDIEGLRGIAVLLVVLYHAAVPGFTGGYIGVDVFFVLSGYLITWLLVREVEKTGTVNLKSFYARRVRRLLPAMGVLLVGIATFADAASIAPLEQAIYRCNGASRRRLTSRTCYFAFLPPTIWRAQQRRTRCCTRGRCRSRSSSICSGPCWCWARSRFSGVARRADARCCGR